MKLPKNGRALALRGVRGMRGWGKGQKRTLVPMVSLSSLSMGWFLGVMAIFLERRVADGSR